MFADLGTPICVTSEKGLKVRVFRPSELNLLLVGIPKMEYRTMFESLLYTGMRYHEMQLLHENPDWLDKRSNTIHLPRMAQQKHEQVQKERWVRLNPIGLKIVTYFLEENNTLPIRQTWRDNLNRWCRNVNLNPEGMSVKCTRKTWESWLVYYYPASLINVLQSQGHTFTTSLQHYLSLPFVTKDKDEMRPFVDGWI